MTLHWLESLHSFIVANPRCFVVQKFVNKFSKQQETRYHLLDSPEFIDKSSAYKISSTTCRIIMFIDDEVFCRRQAPGDPSLAW